MNRWILPVSIVFALPASADGADVLYQGFLNEPLGQACLTPDANGNLIVSNIGSSGLDGVAVDFGATPFEWELALPDAADGPDGAFVAFTTTGVVDGQPDQELLTLRIEDLGNLWGLMVDTSGLMSGSMFLSAAQQDIVFSSDFTPPPPAATVVATFPSGAIRMNPVFAGDVAVFAQLRFDEPTAFTFPQVGVASATSAIGITAVGGPKVAGQGLRFEMRIADLDPVVIEDEDTLPDCVDPFLAGVYCTAKTSSAGCVASMLPDAELGCDPVSGAADFSARAVEIQGFHNGLLFFSFNGAAAFPFSGGTLCMNPPLGRGPVTNSGGSGPLACDGSFALIINDGGPWDPGPGMTTWMQAWYRDPQNGPGLLGTALSDAIVFGFL